MNSFIMSEISNLMEANYSGDSKKSGEKTESSEKYVEGEKAGEKPTKSEIWLDVIILTGLVKGSIGYWMSAGLGL